MIMKTIKSIIFATAVLGLASCSSMDLKPYSFVTPDDIQVENDIKYLLNGAYSALTICKELPVSLDYITDNGYCNDPKCGENTYWRFAQTPADTKLTLMKWERNYAGILRANSVIKYAPTVVYSFNNNEQYAEGENRRRNQIAQALVLRAYFYLDLIDYYGDCPWRDEPEGLTKKTSPRVSKQEIFNNIIMDINESVKWLPVDYTNLSEYGKITKGAALALKARACLYAGQWDWCIKACRDVIALDRYKLIPFSQLFTEEYEKNDEYIFTIQYIPNRTAEGASAVWWSKFSTSSQYQIAYNLADDYYMIDGKPSSDPTSLFSWVNPYLNRDPRLEYTVERYPAAEKEESTTSHTGLKLKKFVRENPMRIHNNDGQDFPIIRYADVLLMLAEALVETDTYDYNEVCSIINQIRQREDVMMPKVEDAEQVFNGGDDLSTEQLRQMVRHERRVELAMEGLRMSDIRRWRIGPEVMKDCLAARYNAEGWFTIHYATRNQFNPERDYLWPIPALEVQNNPMINNPGYYN